MKQKNTSSDGGINMTDAFRVYVIIMLVGILSTVSNFDTKQSLFLIGSTVVYFVGNWLLIKR